MLVLNDTYISDVNPAYTCFLYSSCMGKRTERYKGTDGPMKALDQFREGEGKSGAEFVRYLFPSWDAKYAGQHWNNWKARGFPREHLEAVAKRLRWTMNRFWGDDDPATVLAPWEANALSDLYVMDATDREKHLAAIEFDANKARRIIESNGGKPPPRGVLAPLDATKDAKTSPPALNALVAAEERGATTLGRKRGGGRGRKSA